MGHQFRWNSPYTFGCLLGEISSTTEPNSSGRVHGKQMGYLGPSKKVETSLAKKKEMRAHTQATLSYLDPSTPFVYHGPLWFLKHHLPLPLLVQMSNISSKGILLVTIFYRLFGSKYFREFYGYIFPQGNKCLLITIIIIIIKFHIETKKLLG